MAGTSSTLAIQGLVASGPAITGEQLAEAVYVAFGCYVYSWSAMGREPLSLILGITQEHCHIRKSSNM